MRDFAEGSAVPEGDDALYDDVEEVLYPGGAVDEKEKPDQGCVQDLRCYALSCFAVPCPCLFQLVLPLACLCLSSPLPLASPSALIRVPLPATCEWSYRHGFN